MSKRGWVIGGATVAALVTVAAIVLFSMLGRIQGLIRSQAQAYLSSKFRSDVAFKDFQVSLRPGVHVVITELVLRHNGRTDIAPLIEIRKLSLDASLWELLGKRINVGDVHLEGLQIHTPPRGSGKPLIHATDTNLANKYPVVIRNVIADDAILVPLPKDPTKIPRPFYLHHVEVHNFRFDQPADFHAILTNPKPLGEIDCVGTFGPWQADEPSATPVDAKFAFDHADFKTLKGLSGFLSSRGKFKGPLDYLEVEGQTDMPDFALRTASHPMALHTDYTAIVDGTNGNVILKNVTATFLNSTIVAQGDVVDMSKTTKGRTIDLDAVSEKARIEDLLRLTVKTDKPAMTGYAKLKAKILIPERDQDLIERMSLDGQFAIGDIRFTNNEIQDRIDTLSHKAQGQPQLGSAGTEISELRGKFKMEKSVINFSNLTFAVAGASLAMAGTYAMDTGQLDFHGKLRMDAKLSQTMTGTKSIFLKVVDPFFRKNGVTEIPVKITGTKDAPQYGLDLHNPANKEPTATLPK